MTIDEKQRLTHFIGGVLSDAEEAENGCLPDKGKVLLLYTQRLPSDGAGMRSTGGSSILHRAQGWRGQA